MNGLAKLELFLEQRGGGTAPCFLTGPHTRSIKIPDKAGIKKNKLKGCVAHLTQISRDDHHPEGQ